MRQLYSTAVTSITDYAATVWYKPNVSYPLLNQVQRLGGQAITKAFRSVSLPILEAEARLRPVELRLRLRTLKHVINLHTLPRSHLFWKCRNRAAKQRKRFLSPLARFLQEFRPELDKNHQQPIETIFAYTASPYQPKTQYQVTIREARALAKKEAEAFDNKTTYFTDGSDRNGRLGPQLSNRINKGLLWRKKRIWGQVMF